MKFTFDLKTKEALNNLIKNSSENNIRIKVFYGCGRPAYDVYADFKREDDEEIIIDGINFVVDKKDVKACENIEIKYDKEIYNKDFYIKDLD